MFLGTILFITMWAALVYLDEKISVLTTKVRENKTMADNDNITVNDILDQQDDIITKLVEDSANNAAAIAEVTSDVALILNELKNAGALNQSQIDRFNTSMARLQAVDDALDAQAITLRGVLPTPPPVDVDPTA